VLVLKDQITYGTFVQPACLPEPTTNVFNTRGTIVGYGLTENTNTNVNRPKFVEIPLIDQIKCLLNSSLYHFTGSERTFCAGEQGKKACRGDSGGGFYARYGEAYSVNGIVSSGSFDCDANHFAVFTNVPNFVDWIRQEMVKEDRDEKQGDGATLVCSFGKNNQK
jgi:secreted trypsin-like serine protease